MFVYFEVDAKMKRETLLYSVILMNILTLDQLSSQPECNIADEKRLDCGWHGIVEGTCKARDDCCWSPSSASGFPYCFYNSNISAILKTAVACEHYPPVRLNCNITKSISIHDVFYGRNDGDDSCHNGGGITCFNPNATEIVRNICKNNSTCVVSPKGDFWNFDSNCDGLNAQLKIHYICIERRPSVGPSSLQISSSVYSAVSGILSVFSTNTKNAIDPTVISAFKSSAPSSFSSAMLWSAYTSEFETSTSSPISFSMETQTETPTQTPSSVTSQLQTVEAQSQSLLMSTFLPTINLTSQIATRTFSSASPSTSMTVTSLPVAATPTLSSMTIGTSSLTTFVAMDTSSSILTDASSSMNMHTLSYTYVATTGIASSSMNMHTLSYPNVTTTGIPSSSMNMHTLSYPNVTTTGIASSSMNMHTLSYPDVTTTGIPSERSLFTTQTHYIKKSSAVQLSSLFSKRKTASSETSPIFSSYAVSLMPSEVMTSSSSLNTTPLNSRSKGASSATNKLTESSPSTVSSTPSQSMVISSSPIPDVTNKGTSSNASQRTAIYAACGGGVLILLILIVFFVKKKKRGAYRHEMLNNSLYFTTPSASDIQMDKISQSNVRHVATTPLQGSYDNPASRDDDENGPETYNNALYSFRPKQQ